MADGPNSAATASSDAVGGRVVSKEAAAHFFSWFQAEKEGIKEALSDLASKPRSDVEKPLEEISQKINLLSKEVTKATVYLPLYDQRRCLEHVKVLLGELADRRSVLAPKTKFLFKSKSKPPGAAPVPKPSPDCTAAPLQPVAKTAPATAATFTLEHRKDAHVDIGEVASANRNTNNDCLIRNLENCTVNLIREGVHLGALHISGINNCVVVAGAVAGAAIVRECVGSVLVLGCHQFRMHDSCDVDVYLHVASHPIIEDSDRIGFAPYTLDFASSPPLNIELLDPAANKWENVEDFNWLKQQRSPHWSVIPPENRISIQELLAKGRSPLSLAGLREFILSCVPQQRALEASTRPDHVLH